MTPPYPKRKGQIGRRRNFLGKTLPGNPRKFLSFVPRSSFRRAWLRRFEAGLRGLPAFEARKTQGLDHWASTRMRRRGRAWGFARGARCNLLVRGAALAGRDSVGVSERSGATVQERRGPDTGHLPRHGRRHLRVVRRGSARRHSLVVRLALRGLLLSGSRLSLRNFGRGRRGCGRRRLGLGVRLGRRGSLRLGVPCRKWSKPRVRIGPLLNGEWDAASAIYGRADHREAA